VGGPLEVVVSTTSEGNDRLTARVRAQDEAIQQDAIRRLSGLLEEGAALIKVTSFNRFVLLTGTVPDVASKQLVEQTVARVENVKSVANQLEVSSARSFSERSNDILLASKVKATLADAKDLSPPAFKVVTERGTVYLMGFVSARESDRAIGLIRRVSGVTRVVRAFEIKSEGEIAGLSLPDSASADESRRRQHELEQRQAAESRERERQALEAAQRRQRELLEQERLAANARERQRQAEEVEAEAARHKHQERESALLAAQSAPQEAPAADTNAIRNAHALVIGNAAYSGSARLENPVNDATAMSQKLRSLGFTVTTVTDANRQRLVQAMTQFRLSAASADLTLLFYAGHGVQIFGTNYMLPTDIDQTDTAQATIQGLRLNEVIENFMPGKTKIVFLDACRDNPLQRTGDRGVTKGLAPISVSEGTLISYATKDGHVAADGVGSKNSPFTHALLEHLGDPQDISVVLRKVRAKVMRATEGRQQPWDYGSLTGGELVLSRIRAVRP